MKIAALKKFDFLNIITFFITVCWITVHCGFVRLGCLPLKSSLNGIITYSFKGRTTSSCRPKCHVGTTARVSCNHFYGPFKINETALCLADGSWTPANLVCVPVCGKINSAVSLIVNGPSAVSGSFPWQVAIYNTIENRPEFWCAGSLISERAVLTAAHCTWKIRPEKLSLAVGKVYREIDFEEPHVQVKQAKSIKILETYQDASGNYNGDLSVIFLMQPVDFDEFVSPICIDWDQSLMDDQLKEGNLGMQISKVVGWGLTENETFSNRLRALKLPVASDLKCIGEQESDFRKFVTYTSFCAGFRNGSGVCNGDSGGGLAFWDEKSERWYLQGLVSVSPRKKGTFFCDTNYYTIFTKVSLFVKWLKKLNIIEHSLLNIITVEYSTKKLINLMNEKERNKMNIYKLRDPYGFIRPYFNQSNLEFVQKQLGFPHTQAMTHFLKK